MSGPDYETALPNTEKLTELVSLLQLKDERIAELEAEVERQREKACFWENEVAMMQDSITNPGEEE